MKKELIVMSVLSVAFFVFGFITGYRKALYRCESVSHQEEAAAPEAPTQEEGAPESTAIPHDRIRINFQVEDRKFEAVGFLRDDEESVFGDEMLRRVVGENGWAIGGNEDWEFLMKRLDKLPAELNQYTLVTNWGHRSNPLLVRFFDRYDVGSWDLYWGNLGDHWGAACLVLRRLP